VTDTTPGDDGVESYPNERDGARLLGTSPEGGVAYYHPDDHLLLETDLGPNELKDDSSGWVRRRQLAPSESVGDLVDRIDQSLGVSEMTEYARSHLPGVSDPADSDDADDTTN
jgi:hypothetical protein